MHSVKVSDLHALAGNAKKVLQGQVALERAAARLVVQQLNLGFVVKGRHGRQKFVAGVFAQNADPFDALDAKLDEALLIDGPTGCALSDRLGDRFLAGAEDLRNLAMGQIIDAPAGEAVDRAVVPTPFLDVRNLDLLLGRGG